MSASRAEAEDVTRFMEPGNCDQSSSLFSKLHSLFEANYFPVVACREFSRKPLTCCLKTTPRSPKGNRNPARYPVFSRLSGNLAGETSSQDTASATTQSRRTGDSTRPPRKRVGSVT